MNRLCIYLYNEMYNIRHFIDKNFKLFNYVSILYMCLTYIKQIPYN